MGDSCSAIRNKLFTRSLWHPGCVNNLRKRYPFCGKEYKGVLLTQMILASRHCSDSRLESRRLNIHSKKVHFRFMHSPHI